MNNRKKIYIAGAGGMLGEAFYQVFNDYKLNVQILMLMMNGFLIWILGITEAYSRCFDFKPDYLFHLGAFTDLEFCEQHPNETYITNTLSVENAVLSLKN